MTILQIFKKTEDKTFTKKEGTVAVGLLSLSLMIVLLATNTLNSRLTKDFEDVGIMALVLLFGFFTMSAIFIGPYVITKFSSRVLLFTSLLPYAIMPLLTFLFKSNGVSIGNAISGLGAGVLWLSQGLYIARISALGGGSLGWLNSLYWSIFQNNMLLGQLIVIPVELNLIRKKKDEAGNQINFIMSVLGIVGFLLMLPTPKVNLVSAKDAPAKPNVWRMFTAMAKFPLPQIAFTVFSRGVAGLFVGNILPKPGEDSNPLYAGVNRALVSLIFAVPCILGPLAWGRLVEARGRISGLSAAICVLLATGAVFVGLASLEIYPRRNVVDCDPASFAKASVVAYAAAFFCGLYESMAAVLQNYVIAKYAPKEYLGEAFAASLVVSNMGSIIFGSAGHYTGNGDIFLGTLMMTTTLVISVGGLHEIAVKHHAIEARAKEANETKEIQSQDEVNNN